MTEGVEKLWSLSLFSDSAGWLRTWLFQRIPVSCWVIGSTYMGAFLPSKQAKKNNLMHFLFPYCLKHSAVLFTGYENRLHRYILALGCITTNRLRIRLTLFSSSFVPEQLKLIHFRKKKVQSQKKWLTKCRACSICQQVIYIFYLKLCC